MLLAFGFTTPWMLGWLAAASVPLVIHLLSRRRYRELEWAAMEYLLAALRASRRRMRLEQWLLLFVRTLIVVLVVLAVAEPFFERVGLAYAPGERTHRVMVIDGSYSMAYRSPETSRFDRAKKLAARLVEESQPGDGFTLVVMSDPPKVVVRNPVFARGDFLAEIDRLALTHGSADLPATLDRVEEVLATARREHPRIAREEICVFTDLGRVGWHIEPPGRPAFRERLDRLAASATIVVIDLGQEGADNLAITSLASEPGFLTPGRSVRLEARVQNFGERSHERHGVEWFVDGRRVAQQFVDLEPREAATLAFSHRFDAPGEHTLEVRLGEDPLEVDNRRWLSLPVKPSIEVLCVEGRPSGEPFGGAVDYLVAALSPESGRMTPSPIRPQVVAESRLMELDLERYHAIVLADVAQFTSSEARRLDRYVRWGGGLMLFLGEQVMAERYHRELGGGPGGVGLLPARLGPVIDEPQFRLDPLDYRHPIVSSFRDHEQAGLLTSPVSRYFKLTVPERSKARVALALGNGDPLIVEEPIGRGRVVLFATSADDSWTMLPKWPSFLPLTREALGYAIGGQIEPRNLRVGEPLGTTVAADAVDAPVVVQTPDGRREQVMLRVDEGVGAWTYEGTATSGIYRAELGPPLERDEAFAVNVDPLESDLTRIAPEELEGDLWSGVTFIHPTEWGSVEARSVGGIRRDNRLPKGLVFAVLALLLIETFFAWRFGYHATS